MNDNLEIIDKKNIVTLIKELQYLNDDVLSKFNGESDKEGNLLENERREILRFIEKQDNIFSKIENNINQVAKIANAQKYIKKKDFLEFSAKQDEMIELKKKQNEIFLKIYTLLGKEI